MEQPNEPRVLFEIEHDDLDFHLVQIISGHGCFYVYLHRFKKKKGIELLLLLWRGRHGQAYLFYLPQMEYLTIRSGTVYWSINTSELWGKDASLRWELAMFWWSSQVYPFSQGEMNAIPRDQKQDQNSWFLNLLTVNTALPVTLHSKHCSSLISKLLKYLPLFSVLNNL